MKINLALTEASNILKKKGINTYKLDTEILMSNVIQKDRKELILGSEKFIDEEDYKKFKKLIFERSCYKPISYLIKKKEFWNSEFYINKDVLIPRPETEHLVNEALSIIKDRSGNILDIGVGSGCIILSILKEKINFRGIGVDLHKGPIMVSTINAEKLGLQNRVKFIKSDIDNFCFGKYDLIVSNPPYIKKNDLKYLEKDVINFEPLTALNGGLDGISEIGKVINKTSKLIKINGKFIIEIAYNQKKTVIELLKKKGFYINKIVKDYSKKDRCIISTKL